MSHRERLERAFLLAEEASNRPCDGCRHFTACAQLQIACRVFFWWVHNNRPKLLTAGPENREPNKREFLRLLGNDDE